MVQLLHMKTFVQVAECGSFSKASKQLFLNPSSLMQQINLLEDSLGVALFVRSHKGLTLTDAGHIFYKGAKRILADVSHLEKECKQVAGQKKKTLTVGIYSPSHVIDYCLRYAEEHPEVVINYVSMDGTSLTDVEEFLRKRKVDVMESEQYSKIYGDEISFLPVDSMDYFCCLCMQSNPLYTKSKIKVSDLKEQKVYLYGGGSESTEKLLKALRKQLLPCQIIEVPYSDGVVYESCKSDSVFIGELKYLKKYHAFKTIPLTPKVVFETGFAYMPRNAAAVEFISWMEKEKK